MTEQLSCMKDTMVCFCIAAAFLDGIMFISHSALGEHEILLALSIWYKEGMLQEVHRGAFLCLITSLP